MKTATAKHPWAISSKQIVLDNEPLSVTDESATLDPCDRIDSGRDSIKGRYRRLKPFLDFAYLPDTFEAFKAAYIERFGGKYRPDDPPSLTTRARIIRLPRDEGHLRNLMRQARGLREILDKLPNMEAEADCVWFSVEYLASADSGRLVFAPNSLYSQFMKAAAGDIRRWKRCQVCQRVFFAVRSKPGSNSNTQTCSLPCNRVRRMREWRDGEQSKIERAGKLLLQDKSVGEIASALGVDMTTARRYIAQAKKRQS